MAEINFTFRELPGRLHRKGNVRATLTDITLHDEKEVAGQREECIPDKRKNTSKDLEVVKEHVSYRAL